MTHVMMTSVARATARRRRRLFAGLMLVPLGLVLAGRSAGAQTPAPNVGKRFQPGLYRGKLGEAPIELRLAWQDIEDSVEGSYIVFGQPDTIQVVGEFEGAEFVLEESHNGTDVSGAWSGKVEGDHLWGEWTSTDDSTHLTFDLKRVAPLPTP